MSTKIYNAYRIKKDIDILKLLMNLRTEAINTVCSSNRFLVTLHTAYVEDLADKIRDLLTNGVSKDNSKVKYYIDELKDAVSGELHITQYSQFTNFLEKSSVSLVKSDGDVLFTSAIYYDEDYWYVKFFTNYNWQSDIENKFSELDEVEDFHYQNSTDNPENITYAEYELRGEKWGELLKSANGSYSGGLRFDLMNAIALADRISANYYTGKKTNDELYEHLAYNFLRTWRQDTYWAEYIR